MLRTISFAGLAAFCCTLSAASADTPRPDSLPDGAKKEISMNDLKQDPKVYSGVLPNGLHYFIRPNAEPKGRISIRMRVNVGSLSEKEDERGLSHFLEHMVFAGSKNFKIDDVIPALQRSGLMFGRDVNAYTSFEETVYMIDLPDVKDASIDLAMTLMRDFSDGALFDSQRLDRERGVILNELKTRDSADYRVMKQQLGFLLNGTTIADRLPIGLEEVIQKTPREKFVDYHTKHYAADQVSVIIAGDITPEKGKALVDKYFASLKPSGMENIPNRGELKDTTGVQVKIIEEPESPMTNLSISNVTPYVFEKDSAATRLKDLPLKMATSMLNRRLDILQKKESCPFLRAGASYSDILHTANQLSIDATCQPDKWKPTLDLIEQELRRATEYGFTEEEFEEARRKMIQSADQTVETWKTRPSDEIADGIVASLGDKQVFTDPVEDRRILLPALEKLTDKACSEALAKAWNPDKTLVLATGTVTIPDGEKGLLTAYEASAKEKVSAPERRMNKSFPYEKVGEAGQIADKKKIEDLDIVQIKLSNGVTVNYKRTDFENNTISIQARVNGGKVTLPQGKSGMDIYASSIMNGGGLEGLNNDELERLFAGHNVGVQFGITDDSFVLGGSTNEKDLEKELKLLCAYLQHAGYNEDADVPFKRSLPALFEQLNRDSAGVFQMNLGKLLTEGDYRFTFPTQEQLASYKTADVKNWLDKPLKENALEVDIVGDFNPDQLEELLKQTFGALPQRAEKRKEIAPEEQLVKYNKPGENHVLTYPTQLDKSMTSVVWKSFDATDKKRLTRLNVLNQILNNRLREEIRDKMSDAYSPGAKLDTSDQFKDYGFFLALSPGTTENSERVAKAIQELGDNLAKGSITPDEMERIRRPLLATLEKSLRINDYWMQKGLIDSQVKPDKLERLRKQREDMESITIDELNALAKEVFPSSNSTVIRVVPAPLKEETGK